MAVAVATFAELIALRPPLDGVLSLVKKWRPVPLFATAVLDNDAILHGRGAPRVSLASALGNISLSHDAWCDPDSLTKAQRDFIDFLIEDALAEVLEELDKK